MRKAVMHVLAVMILSTLLEPVAMAPTAAAPAAPQEQGVYEEDFSAYTHKDYTENARWDIWARALQLEPLGGTSQIDPAVAADGSGGAVVVWEDKRNGDDDIYAQKLDANGNRLWEADVCVSSDDGIDFQSDPVVAVDGSDNAVVVWRDHRDGDYDVYTQRLDRDGNKLWAADVRVNSDTETAYQGSPAVAVDGSGNVVVVWQDRRNGNDDIYAQKLDGDGNRSWAGDVRVNSDSGTAYQDDPAVAVDEIGGAVVVWDDGDICAQRLDPAGNKLWAADVRVSADSRITYQTDPAVAVDESGSAVVVWGEERSGEDDADIYAQRLDAAGDRLWAADTQVNSGSSRPEPYYPAAVAVDGGGDAVVVWRDKRNEDGDIYAQHLDSAGNKLWAADVRVNSDNGTNSQGSPAVAVDGRGNAIVVWQDGRNGDADIYTQKLDGGGNELWAADVRINSEKGMADQSSPAVAMDGNENVIVVWQDRRNGDYDIYAQKLDGDGNNLWTADVRVNSDNGTAYQGSPAVAVDGSGDAIVVWSDDRNGDSDIYAQVLDGSGNKMWPTEVRVNSDNETTGQVSPAVAMDGNGNAIVVWAVLCRPPGMSIPEAFDLYIYAQRLDGSGNKLWTSDVCVGSGGTLTGCTTAVAVAVDRGGDAFVVWCGCATYAQKVDANGNRLWSTDVRVSPDQGTASTAAVDGSGNIVVVWFTFPSVPSDIYAQKLDGNGNSLWADDVRVNSGSGTMFLASPTVAVDGSGCAFIVWHDDRNGDGDIYAQRLDASGNREWTDDGRVNSDSEAADQGSPAVAMDRGGSSFVLWADSRNGNADIYAQRINLVGNRVWLGDLQVVYPDRFHFPTGIAQSRTVDDVADDIAQATLTADYQTNGGGVQFHLTNDAGAHWARVTPGVTHLFTTTGSDLRWRAVLTADPVWLRTPVVDSLRIEYSNQNPYADDYEPDDTCTQASPFQVNGAVQAHTFHQPDDEDWAWFDVVSGTTYVLQTTHAGPNADTVLELHDICDHPILTDTNAFGHDARLLFTAPSDATFYARVTNQDGSVYGEDTDYDLSVRTYHPNGLAVVVAGHNDAWQLQSNIDYAADQAYLTLLEAGFPKANVRYLGPNPDRDVDGNGLNDDVAATATITNVRYAVQDWPREQGLALGVPFYVYLMDHGHYDQFLANGSAEKVTAPLLDLWLSNLEATTGADQITVVIDACKSGSFIDVTGPGPAEISGLNRVIVASTTSQANAYPSVRGSLFSDVFWTALGDNQDVWSAYRTAKTAVDARGLMQTPWLDDNGDAVANEEDGDLARGRGLAGVFGGSEPVIDWLTVGQIGAGGTATVAAQVRDDFRVTGVHVEVYPPGYEEPEGGPGETPVVGVPTTTLTLAETDTYKATLTGLTASGTYRVVGYAVDDEGNWALPRWALVHSGETVYLPLVLK